MCPSDLRCPRFTSVKWNPEGLGIFWIHKSTWGPASYKFLGLPSWRLIWIWQDWQLIQAGVLFIHENQSLELIFSSCFLKSNIKRFFLFTKIQSSNVLYNISSLQGIDFFVYTAVLRINRPFSWLWSKVRINQPLKKGLKRLKIIQISS